ncbi:MAG TPA: aldo/keto reductase [Burkholderiaceae bacterium]|nr:aldo/keto reductase [Burkholderiaceae bacterium]
MSTEPTHPTLGRSGLKVAPLWLGTMMFGDQTDEAEAARIVDSARAAGVNGIDTADVYAKGESERIVGRLIAADRERWVLATKVANPMGDAPNDRGLSRRWILRAVEASLARLGTDWIDVYYLHRDDPTTPMEETVATIAGLIERGMVRYFGVSNYSAWRIAEMVALCRAMGVPQPIVCQPPYNAMTRGIEAEVLPGCAAHGIGVVSYSPLARGVLTGKYRPAEAPAEGTRAARADRRLMQTEFRPESLALSQQFAAHAARRGFTASQFATAWVLHNRLIAGVIAGPRTLAQWEDYVGALALTLDAHDEAFIDGLVPPGHASTHGYTDPLYPVTGRMPRSARA